MTKKPRTPAASRLHYENFLYLLAEMERAIELGQQELSADRASAILIRLGRIVQTVTLALAR
jgi:hypothetical protein